MGNTCNGLVYVSVREIRILRCFQISKTWLFTFFWNDVSKSRKKSLAKV